MPSIALALIAASAFGTADFLGGFASRRASVVTVILVSQSAGFVIVVPTLLIEMTPVHRASLIWGAVAGVAGCFGLLMLFRALAIGVMSVAAPITAVIAAGLPVLVGFGLGERPGLFGWLGIGAGLAAILVVGSARSEQRAATSPGQEVHLRSVVMALAAGTGFGVFFVCLSRTPPSAGVWPLLAARTTSVMLVATIALALMRARLRADFGVVRLSALSGLLDMTANVLFLLAVRRGSLALVAVLVSLYPAVTVMLALILLRERLGAPQLVGVGLAVLAIALIAAA